jgi:exodeoxyribonuclease V gamma subunit
MPMRAIPFRRVCLLGMNDGDYPRSRTPLDFDLMRRDYRPGDRSRREDDRYLFLEALLSARDHLHVSWVGRSVTDNTPRPPSVLVGQLREHLRNGWRLAGSDGRADALLAALTVEHRLQPFSADYFPARPEASPLFTYADEWNRPAPAPALAPADASDAARIALPPATRDEPLSLRELAEFLGNPVRAFFRQRLRVGFDAEDEASENHEPFSVDALKTWQLQNELIRAQVAALARGDGEGDGDVEAAALARLERMHRSGDLASGGFGEVIASELMAPMPDLFERYRGALARWPQALEGQFEVALETTLEDGRTLAIDDWIDDLREGPDGTRGRVILDAGTLVKDRQYRGERLIPYWVAHLAAQLAGDEVTTMVVSKVGGVEFAPLSQTAARAHLLALLRAWDEGMRRPLPLAARTAFAWLRKLPDGVANAAGAPPEAWDAARVVYEGGSRQPGERDHNAYLQRAYPDFEALARSGEFAALALDLLLPLHRAIPAASKSKSAAKRAGETA